MFNSAFRDFVQHSWDRAVTPSAYINQPDNRRRIRFLNVITVFYSVFVLLILILQLLFIPFDSLIQMTSFHAMIMGLGISLIFYVVSHSRYYRYINYLAVLTTYISIGINAVASEAPHVSIAYVIIIPLIGILLLSPVENVFASVFSMIELVVIAKLMGDMPDKMLIDLLILCVLTNAIIIFVSYQRDQLESDRHKALIELEKTHISAQFIRDVSHEFRTPLSVISTGVYLLAKTSQTEDRLTRAAGIENQITYLTQLLEDSLTISQLDSQVGSDFHEVAIDKLVQNFLNSIKSMAVAKGLTLELTNPMTIPTIQGNEANLQLAVKHLLKNAINYTEQGGIQVRLIHQRSTVRIEIQDTGIGIPEADLNHIFDPFYRVDQARTTRSGGLGLTIVKKIVENHHGTIAVESVLGKGTTFTISIPAFFSSTK